MSESVGWQADGSYVLCSKCACPPPPKRDDPPFMQTIEVMPRTPGTAYHHGTCPTVALPKDVQDELNKKLDEMDRCRRRAEANARFYVIG